MVTLDVGTLPSPTAPVALVISDEKMPSRSGTDLLIALRQSPAHRQGGCMIIIVYSGLAWTGMPYSRSSSARPQHAKKWSGPGG